jgi:hypothetical protein
MFIRTFKVSNIKTPFYFVAFLYYKYLKAVFLFRYKEVLEANRKFQIEDDLKEKYNEKNSVSNKADLTAIYKTFYNENLFAGGDRIDINAKIKDNPQLTNKIRNNSSTIKKNNEITAEIPKRSHSRSRSRSDSTSNLKQNKDQHIIEKYDNNKNKEKKETKENSKNENIEKNGKKSEFSTEANNPDPIMDKKKKLELARKRFEERKKKEEIEGMEDPKI